MKLNDISPKKKNNNHFNTLYSSHQSILNEIKNSDYNIRIVESPNQNKNFNNFKFQNEIGSKTFYKEINKNEEDKFDIGEIKKTDISSEEFFMRRSQMNYIKKNLSPVKAISLSNNANFINNNISNSSIRRIFSARLNNHANLIKSDLILIWNIIQKNSNIINFYKHQFQNEIDNSNKSNVKSNKLTLNTSTSSTVSKLSLQNILVQKRCLEIENENKENFCELIEKVNENSKNVELLMNNFKCLVKEELIFKLALENHLNQLLIKKIDDLFFLMNLKNLNENNEFSNVYSDTHSKMQNIKNFIELMKKLLINKKDEKVLITSMSHQTSKSSVETLDMSKKFNNNKLTNNSLMNMDDKNNYCFYNCDYCMKISNKDNEEYDKYVVHSSNSIKSIPEVNELNETFSNSKIPYSKRNSVITSKNNSLKIKRKQSGFDEKSNGNLKFDLIKMQSSNEIQEEHDLGNEDYDSNKILEMKTFAEFKNYETENVILNHIKKLHDNTSEKIFKIFYDFFVSKYPDEKDTGKPSSESSIMNKNIQRTKTKLRGMLLKKNDDGIMSFLFIREEFEKIIKDKEDLVQKISKINLDFEEKIQSWENNSIELGKQLTDLKKQLNKKEADIKIHFLQNLETENKKFMQHATNKLENKIKTVESENCKLLLDIDVLNTKIKSMEREKQDLNVKLEYFTLAEERRKRKKKLNESYEDVLIEQFDNMKKGYQDELEKVRKEITLLKHQHKMIINKVEMECEELKIRNQILYKQMEDLQLKL